MRITENKNPFPRGFDMDKNHEGVVLETSSFESKGTIQVYIPDMFIGLDSTRISMSKIFIKPSKIINSQDIKYSQSIDLTNYIDCYPLVLNGFTIGSLKPNVGETVIVQFLNGDIKLPYYINAHYLKEEEEIANINDPAKDDGFSSYGYYRIIKLKEIYMSGPDIYKVAMKLISLEYDISDVDGEYFYNEEMYEAIQHFQSRVALTDDGEIGPITFSMLMRYEID